MTNDVSFLLFQEDVFISCIQPIMDKVILGFNGTIFVYGQTGSGKSYTVIGNNSSKAHKGLILRCSEEILARCAENENQNQESSVSVSFLEIYNEHLRDLLVDDDTASSYRSKQSVSNLKVIVDPKSKTSKVIGLRCVPVKSNNDINVQLIKGNRKKVVQATNMNAESSRSHTIFTLELKIKKENEILNSKLHLIDLAVSKINDSIVDSSYSTFYYCRVQRE